MFFSITCVSLQLFKKKMFYENIKLLPCEKELVHPVRNDSSRRSSSLSTGINVNKILSNNKKKS